MTEAIDQSKVLEFLQKRKNHWKAEGFPENAAHHRARLEGQEALKKRGVPNHEAVYLLHKTWDRNNCSCCVRKKSG